MSRPSMSAETIANNKVRIINAAMDIIHEGGIQSVSARALGNRIGMNSALIYRYFKDINEVILFACVHALREYTEEMSVEHKKADESVGGSSDKALYLLSWELFSKHAFRKPKEYHTIFFGKHSHNLKDVIREYYSLCPLDTTDQYDIILEGMYRTADLRERNLILLKPVLSGTKTEQEIILINDMTIAFFYTLLVQLIQNDGSITPDQQCKRMMDAVHYTLNDPADCK